MIAAIAHVTIKFPILYRLHLVALNIAGTERAFWIAFLIQRYLPPGLGH